jgi:hypothetical protein
MYFPVKEHEELYYRIDKERADVENANVGRF